MLLLNNLFHQNPDIPLLQRTEAESSTATQQRRAQLVRVVGNDAKPRIRCILFHDSSQRHLRRVGHGICLIQDNELEPGHRARLGRCTYCENLFGAGECLDLLADHVDASVIGGIELKHHLAHVGGAIDSTGEGQDC